MTNKSSKFEEWFNNELILIPDEQTEYDIAKQTWKACKNEISNIIGEAAEWGESPILNYKQLMEKIQKL